MKVQGRKRNLKMSFTFDSTLTLSKCPDKFPLVLRMTEVDINKPRHVTEQGV